ncbi:phosphotransferase [Tsukamurella sp. 1534]|uniref:phosphotransferase n=1 Tax=Tsukamurella sp. 1534 TaxID=1151061 RepID=UPI000315B8FF|nr:phosphotransferase [Tsukamurella sp. 1534]
MLTPPTNPTSDEVLAAVRRHWEPGADAATHLPVGFGAHHWRIDRDGTPWGFATVDSDTALRPLGETASAYAAAARLHESGVPGVVSPLPTSDGARLVPMGGGGLSVTPWLDGRTPTAAEALAGARRTVELLEALHAAEPPAELPGWVPRAPAGLAELVEEATRVPWTSGPYGEPARKALRARLSEIATWAERHRELAERAAESGHWVPTHGEPHHANQLIVASGQVFVDWESLRCAPPERDLLDIPSHLREQRGARPWAVELFRLEWRLSEIAEYVDWFGLPHSGGADDDAAFAGLCEELMKGPD